MKLKTRANTFSFVVLFFRRNPKRFFIGVVSTSLGFIAIFLSYGVSSIIDAKASAVFSTILAHRKAIVIPANGMGIDEKSGLLIPYGSLENLGQISGVIIKAYRYTTSIGDFILYSDPTRKGNLVGTKELLDEISDEVILDTITISAIIPPNMGVFQNRAIENLPNLHPIGEWKVLSSDLEIALIKGDKNVQIVYNFEKSPFKTSEHLGTCLFLEKENSRINPFSLQTQFSAFVMGSQFASFTGFYLRLIFIFSIIFSIIGAVQSMQDRSTEIRIWVYWGLQNEILKILLLEYVIISFVSLLFSSIFSLIILRMVSETMFDFIHSTSGFGFLLAFLPLSIIPSALVASNKAYAIV